MQKIIFQDNQGGDRCGHGHVQANGVAANTETSSGTNHPGTGDDEWGNLVEIIHKTGGEIKSKNFSTITAKGSQAFLGCSYDRSQDWSATIFKFDSLM